MDKLGEELGVTEGLVLGVDEGEALGWKDIDGLLDGENEGETLGIVLGS